MQIKIEKRKTYPVEPGFSEARKRLVREYVNANQANISKKLVNIGAKNTINQLFSENIADNHFTTKLQINVLGLYKDVSIQDIHKWIVAKASFSFEQQYEKFLGEYKYWRSFPNEENQTLYDVRVGRLRISQSGGVLVYQHRSANSTDETEWEDDGLAFFHGRRLYCLGFRDGNMRLVIAHIPDDISKQWLHGIVLSVQKANQKIFSASFAMFHQSFGSMFNITDEKEVKRRYAKLGLAQPYMNAKIMID